MIKDLIKSVFRGFGYTLGKLLLFALIIYLLYLFIDRVGIPKGVILPI